MKSLDVLLPLTILAGCTSSMTATEFYTQFPRATKSQFMLPTEADEAVLARDCIVLASHQYTASQAMTAGGDLKNGAEGVDAIVENDGGNAYRLSDYGWIQVNAETQLVIDFDTLLCSIP